MREVIYIQKEELRQIDGFENYFVSNLGVVYSSKSGTLKPLSTWLDSQGNYLMVSLNGTPRLLHRLVAKAFIPNPNQLPEVNHKDKNKQNPKADNLEWCTRKENLNDSYSTMSPTRNYRVCRLYKSSELLGEFKGVAKAARYAQKKYGASFSSLDKYLRSGEFHIEYDGEQTRNTYKNKPQKRTYLKGDIKVYKNGYRIATFKTFPEVETYFKDALHLDAKERALNSHCNTGKEYKGYEIKRDK